MQISRLTLASLIFTCIGILSAAAITACLPYQNQVPFWIMILLGTNSAACPTIAVAIQAVQPIKLSNDGKVKDPNLIQNK